MTMSELHTAKALLREGGYTCVLCGGETVLTCRQRGVRPLLEYYQNGPNVRGFVAADKVVGKAAALLYVLLGIRGLYADVLSLPAKAVLEQYGIPVEYNTLTDAIRNRAGDGYCPMEQAVRQIDDPRDAPAVLEETLSRLSH